MLPDSILPKVLGKLFEPASIIKRIKKEAY